MLGFGELSDKLISKGLCAKCGACVAVCPLNSVAYEDGQPKLVGKCTDCGICIAACPRYDSPSAEMKFVFGRQRNPDEDFGIYKQALVAQSTDKEILKKSQDGGVVTTLLVSALESGIIDGAIVSAIDKKNPWLPLPYIAKTRGEIIENAGTRYCPSPGLTLLKSSVSAGLQKIAFVGTPCQILAIRRIQNSFPKYTKNVLLTIGLFCAENFYYNDLMIGKIQNELGINLKDIEKVNIKGKFLIYLKNGQVKEISLKETAKFAMTCCHYCGDFSAELADIACGGVGLDGWTYTLIRTDKGTTVFDDAVKKGLLKVEPTKNFPVPTKTLIKMSKDKRKLLNP